MTSLRSKQARRESIKERPLLNYVLENGKSKDDDFVNVTIFNVPGSLVIEFMQTVWPRYPGGISEALQDLMRKEVQKQKRLDDPSEDVEKL
jgi:hypothetical protein